MKRSLTQLYLEELRDAVNYILNDSGSQLFSSYAAIPWIALVFVVASSSSIYTSILGLSIALTVFSISFRERICREFAIAWKPLVIVTVFTIIVSLPLILSGSTEEARIFLLRVTASSAVFTLILRSIGWRNIFRALELLKIPRILIDGLYRVPRFIPLFLGDTMKLLSAREARFIGKRRCVPLWNLLASVASDTLSRAFYRARALQLAIEARTLSISSYSSYARDRPRIGDVVLCIAALATLAIEVVYRLWSS